MDWLDAKIPLTWARHLEGRGRAAVAAELEAKARLLQRLGYPRAHALARCLADLDWEFELCSARPPDKKAVKAIVDAVYG